VSQPTLAVANYFIGKALDSGDRLTPLKLVKLVYIAHGWHLAVFDRPLIGEEVQAWKYGPVVPSVYHQFKEYGDKPITRQAAARIDGQLILPTVEHPETAGFIDEVWQAYAKFTGGQLSTLTHRAGTPWHTVWHERGGSEALGTVIPPSLIKHYYQRAERTHKGA
jgi:uncharacterized phage-associated protein